ncbi:1344_t:CDS:10 [Entrophospora sp. SA101]|nr:1344_t:CDS:10 [Entrophospora sp. SA101]CAJ0852627.1 2714_t:CDS:10 [Entrophospora sp. SA101]
MEFTSVTANNNNINNESKNTFQFLASSPPKQTKTHPPPSTVIHKANYKHNPLKSPVELRQKRIELDVQLRRKHQPEFDLSPKDIEKLKSGLNGISRNIRLSNLKQLSKYLVDPSENLKGFVIKGKCIEMLTRFLSGIDPEEQLQATWCVTNIAAGNKEFVQKALTTVPYLISFLDDQATWAIGNIAIENPECRNLLRANGVLVPLINLLDSNHLATEEMSEVLSEVAWVLTYLTCDGYKYTEQLLKEGLAPLLVKHLRPLLNQGPLALPLIRTFGNIASGPDEHAVNLIQQTDFLPMLLEYIQSNCRSIKKESLWVLSNITAVNQPEIMVKIVNSGFIPILSNIAKNGNFDIRKEAAYCLLNIASHGENFLNLMSHKELLPGFLEFLSSQDVDLIFLGLQYVGLLLAKVLDGKKLINQIHGIDALESVTMSEDQNLRKLATIER